MSGARMKGKIRKSEMKIMIRLRYKIVAWL